MKCGRTVYSLSRSNRAPVHKRSNTAMTQPPQILVADDDRLIRLTLEAGLSMYGFRVSLARSGREALQAALENRFDGIISDVNEDDFYGNRQHTADLVGITRRTIQRLIARYNLSEVDEAESVDGGDAFEQ